MKSHSRIRNKQMIQSISEYQQSMQKDQNKSSKSINEDFEIQFHSNIIQNNQQSKQIKKSQTSLRKTRQKSERYLKQKRNKNNDEHHNSKTYDQNFFNSVKNMNQLNKSMHKTIYTNQIKKYDLLKQKNPQIIQLAVRYGMYTDKPKNIFSLSINKKSKKHYETSNINSSQLTEKKQKQISQLNSKSQKSQQSIHRLNEANKVNDINVKNREKNFSLMLDRKKITKLAKNHDNQNKNINSSAIQRNIKVIQTTPSNKNKIQRKIQFFVHQQFHVNLNSIKTKINNNKKIQNNGKIIHKQQEYHSKKIYKKQGQNSPRIYYKQKNNSTQQHYQDKNLISLKHSSFTNIKYPVQKNYQQIKQQKITQIIPKSITFKKDQSSRTNFTNKYAKHNQKNQSKNQIYFPLNSKESKKTQILTIGKQTANQLILLRPKTHKDSRMNTQATTILKQSRRQLISAKALQFTFIFDSKDHSYVSQCLGQNGWRQFVPSKLPTIPTLKWVNNPITSEILNLKETQFYNHFHKSFELTSKSFLNANLKANRHFLRTQQFFPQTFDVGNQAERQQFIKEFKYNVMMKLLENIMAYCLKSQNHSNFVLENIQKFEFFDNISDFQNKSEEENRLQSQFFNVMEFQNFKQRNDSFKLNIFLIVLALKFYRKQRKKYHIDFKQSKKHILKYDKIQFQTNYEALEFYSKHQNVGESCDQKSLFSYHYATPSEFLLKILIKQFCFFDKLHGWKYSPSQPYSNVSNIWIVKPSSNARGNGIYLQTNVNNIVKSAKDIQSRIVQNYIEYPLLFKNTKYEFLNNHKFDLRQWVLIKSLDPLQIYMFSHFYLRLASQKYQIEPIQNNKVHLTNFSANKDFFKDNQHSIVNSDDFIEFLQLEHNIDWQQCLKPQIKSIIIKSIQSCQQKLQNSPNGTCFELLGYDILIDQNMIPWLIEVNMSPACQQRTQWLTEYLKNMNQGLLEIVLPINHLLASTKRKKRKQYWQKIFYEQYFFNSKDYDPRLQIASQNYQNKPKTLKQNENEQKKSKSSLDGSSSPSKFRRKSKKQSQSRPIQIVTQQKQINKQDVIKLTITSELDNIVDEIEQIKDEQNSNLLSFIVEDFNGDEQNFSQKINELIQDEQQEQNIDEGFKQLSFDNSSYIQ